MRETHLARLVCLALFLLATGCGDKIEPGTSAINTADTVIAPVAVTKITQQPLVYEAVGTITARTASTISSKIMGTVLAVKVNEGAIVQEGDVLATLDPRQVTAQVDKAQGALTEARRAHVSAGSARDAAKAAYQLAEATYKRYQQLIKDDSASRQEFEEVEARHRQAQATLAQTEALLEAAQSRVQQAEAALREVTVAKKDAVVRAPYKGRVISKMVDAGDLASPGTPMLALEQEGSYLADLVLPERFIQEVRIGMQVKVVIDALNNIEVEGTIGRIIPSADARSRSFLVKVDMPEGPSLKSGMFARVYIPIGGTGMLLIPNTALVHEGQLTGVFVLDQENTAHFRLVRTGKTLRDRVEIISGLKPGQRYIEAIPPKLQNGSRVEEG